MKADKSPQADAPLQAGSYSRWRRYAIGVSVVFHVLLLVALLVWAVRRERERPTTEGGNSASAKASQASPATRPTTPNPPEASPRPPEPSPEVSANQVSTTLERTMEKIDHQKDEEKLSELEEQAAKLEELASAEAVDEIAQKFHEWMNTSPRAGRPAEGPVEGDFDYSTAQIHQVTQLPAAEGEAVAYRAILLDAAGRTLEVEMNQEEGKRAYETLEKIKKFPLADKVYRQIAMPLIDQAIEAQRRGAAKAEASEKESGEAEADDRDPFDETP